MTNPTQTQPVDEHEERISQGLAISETAQTLTLLSGASITLTLLAWRTLQIPQAAAWYTAAHITFIFGLLAVTWSLIATIPAWHKVHTFAKNNPTAYKTGQNRIENLPTNKRFIWQSDRYGNPKN